mgnify:CR=1 FL=1
MTNNGKIKGKNKKAILIINKIDLVKREKLLKLIDMYQKEYHFEAVIPISSLQSKYRDIILDEIEKNLKPGPAYYDTEEYTDQTLRQLAEETIREKALILLKDEVPHGIFVQVEKMKLKKKTLYNILMIAAIAVILAAAYLFFCRNTQLVFECSSPGSFALTVTAPDGAVLGREVFIGGAESARLRFLLPRQADPAALRFELEGDASEIIFHRLDVIRDGFRVSRSKGAVTGNRLEPVPASEVTGIRPFLLLPAALLLWGVDSYLGKEAAR